MASRLSPVMGNRISRRMHLPSLILLPAALALVAPLAAHAATKKPDHAAQSAASSAPKSIGVFNDWQAATHEESGHTVCYAFTRATSSSPVMSGRGQVVLTVAERPTGRDAVAISAGFTYPAKAAVKVDVEKTSLDFYTAGRAAFARDGAAAVAAFKRGNTAVAKSPNGHGDVSDTFSLKGFTAAYDAIVKACPAK